MSVIPCERDAIVRARIERFVETLKTEAHLLGAHGLSEKAFCESPILRGAIEVMRGEYSARLGPKREFVKHVLNYLDDGGHIAGWERDEGRARHDYTVQLNSGRIAVIDLKGCLDGRNWGHERLLHLRTVDAKRGWAEVVRVPRFIHCVTMPTALMLVGPTDANTRPRGANRPPSIGLECDLPYKQRFNFFDQLETRICE